MNGNTNIDINIEIYIQRHNGGPTYKDTMTDQWTHSAYQKNALKDIATDWQNKSRIVFFFNEIIFSGERSYKNLHLSNSFINPLFENA